MTPAPLDARNRRTATRIVGAVLLFHGLALGAGVWLLHQATHADAAMARAAMPGGTTVAAVAVVPPEPSGAGDVRAELPGWVLKSRRSDTSAPWRVDTNGHVLLNSSQ